MNDQPKATPLSAPALRNHFSNLNAATRARIERIVSRASDYLTPGQAAALREIVEHELRCQDRDTRGACAAAVEALDDGIQSSDSVSTLSAASRACINVQAI